MFKQIKSFFEPWEYVYKEDYESLEGVSYSVFDVAYKFKDGIWKKFFPLSRQGPVWGLMNDEEIQIVLNQIEFHSKKDFLYIPKQKNTPIEQLIQEFENESNDFSDLDWVKKTALRYVKTMPDSQHRCLLYTLAKNVN